MSETKNAKPLEHYLNDEKYRSIIYTLKIFGKKGLEPIVLKHLLVKKKEKKEEYKYKGVKYKNIEEFENIFYENAAESRLLDSFGEYINYYGISPNCLSNKQELSIKLKDLKNDGYLEEVIVLNRGSIKPRYKMTRKLREGLIVFDIKRDLEKFNLESSLGFLDIQNFLSKDYEKKLRDFLSNIESYSLFGLSLDDIQDFSEEDKKEFLRCYNNIILNFQKLLTLSGLNKIERLMFICNSKKKK